MPFIQVKIQHPTTLVEKEFDIERTINWTNGVNGGNRFSAKLNNTPDARDVGLGNILRIYRNDRLEYTGVITKKAIRKHDVKLNGTDLNGILKRRILFNDAPSAQESSVAISSQLDSYLLIGDITISADTFLVPSQTSQKWQWNYNDIEGFVNHIAERTLSKDGSTYGYNWWLDPTAELYFQPEGSGKMFTALPFTNLVVSEDIENTVNDLTLRGKEPFNIPPDKDSWTETTLSGWRLSTDITTSSLTFYNGDVQVGEFSLRQLGSDPATGLSIYNFRNIGVNGTGGINLEKMSLLSLQQKIVAIPTGGWTGITSGFNLVVDDLDGDRMIYRVSSPTAGAWNTLQFTGWELADGWISESGTFDETRVEKIWIGFESTSWTGGTIEYLIDNFYIQVDEQKSNPSDSTSVADFGTWQGLETQKEVNISSNVTELATNLLNYQKDSRIRGNGSLDGYWDIKPDSRAIFDYFGTTYNQPIPTIVHRLNQDGSESTQLFFGRKELSANDIYHKFKQEIRNALRNSEQNQVTKV